MKIKWKSIMNKQLFILFVLTGFVFSCSNNTEHDNHKDHKSKIYTCPMHPEIVRNEPGQCPICGMKLVEKLYDGQSVNDSAVSILLKPTNEYVVSQIKVVSLQQKEIPLEINATGKIMYDTRETNIVSTRVSGWIEKLYVKYQFQPITKGQKLMDIYSKELLTEQENFLFLLKNDRENETLINATEKRLVLLGFNKEQIEQLKKSKKAIQSVTIYSPYSGHLHDLSGSKSTSSKEGDNMNMPKTSTVSLIIEEGMFVKAGQSIFNIYNPKKVWAVIDVYNESSQELKIGQSVKFSINGSTEYEIEGKIDFIEPVFSDSQKTTSVRVYLDNSKEDLKIGQIFKAKVSAGTKKGLFIPSTAVIHLGNSEVVFVMKNNILKSKAIKTGIKTEEFTEVISGIIKTDKIAENAQMLIDSESFIKLDHEK